MTLIASSFYKSHMQQQLHDFVGDSLFSISKFVISRGESRTWDEWATYFEHKDLKTLNLREAGIFLALCTRMQQSLLDKVSDPSFSWDSISLEEEVFHLECVAQFQEYLYENSKRSVYENFLYYFIMLRLCNEFWINFFSIVNDYDELCYKYIQTILKASREYVAKNISEDKEDIVHTLDSKGNPFSYNAKDLYPSGESYNYIKQQARIFEQYLPELIDRYAGEYVLFENGNVIDHDKNENKLLDRIWETDFVKERMSVNGLGIYCHLVPSRKMVNA